MLWLFNIKGKDEQMKIALLGFGTVGSGVYNILKTNVAKLQRVLPEEIEIKTALVRDATNRCCIYKRY